MREAQAAKMYHGNHGNFQGKMDEDHAVSPRREELGGVELLITQLVRISIAIHRSGARARLERADQTFSANRHLELRDHLYLLIYTNTLPRAKIASGNIHLGRNSKDFTSIQLRLVDANLRRRHRFLYAQRRFRNQEEDQPKHKEQKNRAAKKEKDNNLSHGGSNLISRGDVNQQHGAPPQAQKDESASLTEASSYLTAIDGPIEIPMGGQLSMMAPSSTSAKIEYPRALKVTGQELFVCPCCCQSLPVSISSGPQWRCVTKSSRLAIIFAVNR